MQLRHSQHDAAYRNHRNDILIRQQTKASLASFDDDSCRTNSKLLDKASFRHN